MLIDLEELLMEIILPATSVTVPVIPSRLCTPILCNIIVLALFETDIALPALMVSVPLEPLSEPTAGCVLWADPGVGPVMYNVAQFSVPPSTVVDWVRVMLVFPAAKTYWNGDTNARLAAPIISPA